MASEILLGRIEVVLVTGAYTIIFWLLFYFHLEWCPLGSMAERRLFGARRLCEFDLGDSRRERHSHN